jgi:hypothetical protein
VSTFCFGVYESYLSTPSSLATVLYIERYSSVSRVVIPPSRTKLYQLVVIINLVSQVREPHLSPPSSILFNAQIGKASYFSFLLSNKIVSEPLMGIIRKVREVYCSVERKITVPIPEMSMSFAGSLPEFVTS